MHMPLHTPGPRAAKHAQRLHTVMSTPALLPSWEAAGSSRQPVWMAERNARRRHLIVPEGVIRDQPSQEACEKNHGKAEIC